MDRSDINVYLPLYSRNAMRPEGDKMKTENKASCQLVLSTIVTTLFLMVAVLAPSVANAQVKAFPTAEGYGANSVGGRGGVHIPVTNLNDSGPGSFRAALSATGPRIITFRVSGTINLLSNVYITGEANSFVTVAGQSSPGGIQLKDGGVIVYNGAHDVTIRHLRVRYGAPAVARDTNSFLIYTDGLNPPVYNVIIDHCSLQWATDELLTIYNKSRNITVQWCLIAEGTNTGHSEGLPHNAGLLVHGEIGKGEIITVSAHHNLLAHAAIRSPTLDRTDIIDFRNNVIYNWGSTSPPTFVGNNALLAGDLADNRTARFNFVNNHYIAGANSSTSGFFFLANGASSRDRGGTKVYSAGNWSPTCPSGCANDWDNGFSDLDGYPPNIVPAQESKYRVSTPFSVPQVVTDPTASIKSKVTATVGAYKPSRDSLDTRIVNDVLNGTGNIANIGAGGPWPTLTGGTPPVDTDGDGMPDSWELAHGLNPKDPSDGSRIASNGYTNVENYLNELAGDPIPGGGSPPPPPSNLQVSP